MIDILGEYPQVAGYYYKEVTDVQAVTSTVELDVTYSGIHTEKNTTHTGGTAPVTLTRGGIYLIESSIKYDSTGDGFSSNLKIKVNGSIIAYSNTEGQSETAATTILRAVTFTDNIATNSIVLAAFETNAPTGTTLREGEFESYLKIIRLR